MNEHNGWSNWESQLNAKTAARRHAESLMIAADYHQRCAAQDARKRICDRERKAAHRRIVCNLVIDTVFSLVVILGAVTALAIAVS